MKASVHGRAVGQALVLVSIVAGLLFFAPDAEMHAQDLCQGEHGSAATACDLGSPDATGLTLRGAHTYPGQVRAYQFRVERDSSTAQIYLGDLWYQTALSLWRTPDGGEGSVGGACDGGRGCLAEARTSETRVLQFVRPRVILQRLDTGTYTLLVTAADDPAFEPSRGFTLRVALGAPACAIEEDPGGLYKLGLTIQPSAPRRFDLMTFSAIVAPPYSDLFEFDWQLDGQPVSGQPRETIQRAVSDLAPTVDGEHHVRVTARGARPYPDPDQPVIPPAISAECTFRTS